VSETATAPAAEATEPKQASIVRPTTGLVREWLVAKGSRKAESRAKIDTDAKVEYLKDHPDVTRALAVTMGLEVGTRGVISSTVFTAVAESL
jgi:hypothetical protein